MNQDAPADIAYEALRRAIIEQALPPGTKLREDELAAQFGISRTPVRAVLARLQAEGLVAGSARRTASVARPGLGEARQVFVVRRVLEREAVRLVMARWTPELRERLRRIVRDEQQAHDAGDQRASSRLAGDFHTALAEMTDNFLLQRYLSETVSRCSLILAVHAKAQANECSIHEHTDLIRLFDDGDVDAVVAAMDAHIDAIAQRALAAADGADQGPDLGGVLSRYADLLRTGAATGPDKTRRR